MDVTKKKCSHDAKDDDECLSSCPFRLDSDILVTQAWKEAMTKQLHRLESSEREEEEDEEREEVEKEDAEGSPISLRRRERKRPKSDASNDNTPTRKKRAPDSG